jgi:methyl-accepting chemotaxis protein
MESNRGMRCVILCAFVLILVVLCSSAVIASFAVQQYINQISADVEAALKLSEGEAGEVYSRISYNIGQLDKELMIRYEEALSLLRSGEDASFPSVNISSPIEPHFKEKEALRNEITAELQSILDQYGEAGKRQYSQDSTFIRNMAKETISYAVDAVPRPSLPVMDVVAVPFDTAGKAENAQTLKQNVDKMKKTAEEAKWLHEEFERVRNDNLPIVDYHYKQLGEVNRQLNSVIDKYKQLEQSFPEEADRIKNRVKKEQEEWEKQKAYLEEIASKVDENARDMSQFSVSGPYIEPPAEDEERQMLLARLSEANSALSNLMNSTREVADNVVKDLQKEEPYIFDHFLNPHPYKDVDVRTVDIGELSLLARETLESAIEMNQTSVNRILSAVSNLSSILSQVVSDGSRILGEIASLSIALDLSYSHSENSLRILSKDIASKLAILNQRVQDLNDIIQDTSNWIPELSSELSRRAGIANQFVGQYKNEYSQVYNAKVGFEHEIN